MPKSAVQAVSLPWTASGESAISTANGTVLGQASGADKVKPIASIAKLITVLTVLKKHPLSAGQSGPIITLGADDVALYNTYESKDGSAVAVANGEQISQYQMLQALLLPSANNMADSLALWAYGSMDAYRSAAQQTVAELGMSHTTIGSDASGFSPDTTSTANDLLILGRTALKQPVITEITAQKSADIPVEGTIYSTNADIGQAGITGLKTGTSNEAGNCFLFSATHAFENGQRESFVGVILDSPTSQSRFSEAVSLLNTTYNNYRSVTVAKAGQSLGMVKSAWGQSSVVAPASDVDEFTWLGERTMAPALVPATGKTAVEKGETVGSVMAASGPVALVTVSAVNPPSLWWRVFHP